jgi:quercetin 2,3-dioxygenase
MGMFTKAYTQETLEGDGVAVNRLFPISKRMNFDPFVLWDHFNITAGHGFPEHPHRGFEAITYMLTGGMHHQDNLGNDAFVGKGGAQVFCAGRGMAHSEMPAAKGQSIGIQLWINLPKHLKTIKPSYQQALSENLPLTPFEGGHCRTIVGEASPIKLHTNITYQHVTLEQNKHYQIYINHGLNAIIYVLSGDIVLGDETLGTTESLLIKANEAQNLSIKAKTDSEFMFASGIPHKQPIYQHGPYVD